MNLRKATRFSCEIMRIMQKAQLVFMDGGSNHVCYMHTSSVEKLSCERFRPKRNFGWVCSRHKSLTCLALRKSGEQGQFKHTKNAGLTWRCKTRGMFDLLNMD